MDVYFYIVWLYHSWKLTGGSARASPKEETQTFLMTGADWVPLCHLVIHYSNLIIQQQFSDGVCGGWGGGGGGRLDGNNKVEYISNNNKNVICALLGWV